MSSVSEAARTPAPADLEALARAVAPRHLVPIHGEAWETHAGAFENLRRLRNGETLTLPPREGTSVS